MSLFCLYVCFVVPFFTLFLCCFCLVLFLTSKIVYYECGCSCVVFHSLHIYFILLGVCSPLHSFSLPLSSFPLISPPPCPPLALSPFCRRSNNICPDYSSNFTLRVVSGSATVNDSCMGDWMGDACTYALQLAFPPGVCSQNLMLGVRQDALQEREEYFLVYIGNCSNCVTTRDLINITISDVEDCEGKLTTELHVV